MFVTRQHLSELTTVLQVIVVLYVTRLAVTMTRVILLLMSWRNWTAKVAVSLLNIRLG